MQGESEMADSSTHALGLEGNKQKRNFGFAFNDRDFSDRDIRLEILPLASNMNATCSKVVTLHMSSAILAERSPFFYKLFKNGMKESQQRSFVTLKIDASEEAPLMDLMKFIYGNTLNATTAPDLLEVLMVANKFEVTSCVEYCIELLLKLPMSDFAPLYLELPSCVVVGEAFQPLIDAAKRYLAASHFGDFTKSIQKEAMTLPLTSIEVILGIDGLRVDSEDDILTFILEWTRQHYPKLEERREILTKHLTRFICFPYLTTKLLKGLGDCPDFDHEQISKLVCEAFNHKVEYPYGEHLCSSKTTCGFPKRVYLYRPVKVVKFEFVQPLFAIYLSLKKEECRDLFPSKGLLSQPFSIGGGRWSSIQAICNKKENTSHYFSLLLRLTSSSGDFVLDYFEIAVMKNPFKEFQCKARVKGKAITLREKFAVLYVLRISWDDFMKDDSEYFIDGILHLRFTLTTKNFQA